MNVYDSQRMADLAARRAIRPRRGSRTPISWCSTPAISARRASEKIYSELGKLRELKDGAPRGGRETKLVVAGCVAQAEGAEILRRQPAVDIVVGPQNYHRLPELLRAARARPGVVDTDFPAEDKFDHLPDSVPARSAARRLGLRDGPGGLRQVLLVLRRALYPRRRGLAAGSRDRGRDRAASRARACARSRCSARTSTPITGSKRRRAIGPRRADPRRRRRSRDPRVRYTTSHPNDMSDGADRRPSRHRRARALSPSAGPIGLGPGAGGDEPPPYASRIISASSPGCARRGRTSRSRPISSSAIPARPTPISRRRSTLVRAVGFASSYAFKYSPGREPPPPRGRADRRGDERLAARRASGAARGAVQAFNRATVGRRLAVLFEKPGRHEGQVIGRSPYMQAVFAEGPRVADRRHVARSKSWASSRIRSADALSRQRRKPGI